MSKTASLDSFRTWITVFMIGVLLASGWAMFFKKEKLPKEIRIAGAGAGSFYDTFAQAYASRLEQVSGSKVVILQSLGAMDNKRLLAEGKVDLAIFSDGAGPTAGLAVLSPLFDEMIHVMVRRDAKVDNLFDLDGKPFVIGDEGSAARVSALRLLDHYQIRSSASPDLPQSMDALISHPELVGAITLASPSSPQLRGLLDTGEFKLLSLPDAEALTAAYPFYQSATVPRGLFRSAKDAQAVPETKLDTVSCKALLVTKSGASKLLVNSALDALFTTDLRSQMPMLPTKEEAARWSGGPRHPAAVEYNQPFRSLGALAKLLDFLTANKERIPAILSALYLVWARIRLLKDRDEQKQLKEQKGRLDKFISDLIAVESESQNDNNPPELQTHLDRITAIQVAALHELTHEDVRGDRLFSIFLTQSANLSRKLENRLILASLRK